MGSCVRGCDCEGTVAGGLAVGLQGAGELGWERLWRLGCRVLGWGREGGRETLPLRQLPISYLFLQCDFPGCGREYGKKQHLREHFR